jgi:hypothetical protein
VPGAHVECGQQRQGVGAFIFLLHARRPQRTAAGINRALRQAGRGRALPSSSALDCPACGCRVKGGPAGPSLRDRLRRPVTHRPLVRRSAPARKQTGAVRGWPRAGHDAERVTCRDGQERAAKVAARGQAQTFGSGSPEA